MNALNKVSWKTLWTIFIIMVILDVFIHSMNGTPMTNIGFIKFR